jgi:rhodanese-related sulfurtransferase
VIPSHKKFAASEPQYQQLRSKLTLVMNRLEQIKSILKQSVSPSSGVAMNSSVSNSRSNSVVQGMPAGQQGHGRNYSMSSGTPPSLQQISRSTSIPQQIAMQPHGRQNSVDQGGTGSARSIQISTISAVELQTILASSAPRILIIDVRPLEEFIQGHICWKSVQRPPTSGLINIEPEVLKPGVLLDDIGQALASFGSTSAQIELFNQRDKMDLIIFCDNDSRNARQAHFEILFDALYGNVVSSPKALPKILAGGFMAWNYYISQSKELKNNEWVEIGEGFGIIPFSTFGNGSSGGNAIAIGYNNQSVGMQNSIPVNTQISSFSGQNPVMVRSPSNLAQVYQPLSQSTVSNVLPTSMSSQANSFASRNEIKVSTARLY